ncbi:MAG: 6-phosphofructokinase [Clostridia bacterium]|nr:6-phosphofructokinase [Clostridia bacterium]
MRELKNLIVGQSGGPTAAINATLAGVIKAGADNPAIGKVYGMVNGIMGMLERNIKDLDALSQNDKKIELLKKTPASFLGSCRYKLPKDDVSVYRTLSARLNSSAL